MANPVEVSTPSDLEVSLTRLFNAPPALVFDAWTKPEFLRRWQTGNGATLSTCEVDLRVGGTYRYVWTMPQGEMGMSGEYMEVAPPRRLVATLDHDLPWYPGSTISTMNLSERDGMTLLELSLRFESKEARDIVLSTSWATNYEAGFDALDSVLAEQPV
jgi:uncharacterized protein YndB with AHSA1/START domain